MDKNFKTRNGKYSESNKTLKKDKNTIKKINEKIILENSKGSKYMSGQLCQIIKNGEDKKFEIKTPFGYAKIRRNLVDELVVLGKNAKYTDIVNGIIKKNGNEIENIKEIYDYLSTPSDNSIDSIEKFNQSVKEAENIKEIKARNELAKLSAILMLSEPYRFKDGGGLSRGYIRKAIKDMEGGKGKNALNKIFGNEGEGSEPNAPFARSNKNKKTKKRKKNESQWLSGKKEMEHVLQIPEDKIPDEGVDNEKKESIKKNIKQFSEMVDYISDNEDEDNGDEEKKIYFSIGKKISKKWFGNNLIESTKNKEQINEERYNRKLSSRKKRINNEIRKRRNISSLPNSIQENKE